MAVNSIELRQVRDFGEVLNTTFAFFRENFLNILKTCMPLVTVFILVGCFLVALANSTFVTFSNDGTAPVFTGDGSDVPFAAWSMIGGFLLISGIFYFYIAMYQYMALYLTTPKDQITFSMVWQHSRGKILPILLLAILVVLMLMVGTLLLVVPAIYMAIPLTFTFVMYVVEKKSITDTINRSFTLMNGEWWQCLGLAFVILIILFLLDMVLVLPYRVLTSGFEMHHLYTAADEDITLTSFAGVAFGSAYYILSTIFSSIQLICIAVKYFSVVEEKEAVGMMQKVEAMQVETAHASAQQL